MVYLLRLFLLLSLLCAWPSAYSQDADVEDGELDRQIAAIEKELMEEISVWDHSTNLRLGGG